MIARAFRFRRNNRGYGGGEVRARAILVTSEYEQHFWRCGSENLLLALPGPVDVIYCRAMSLFAPLHPRFVHFPIALLLTGSCGGSDLPAGAAAAGAGDLCLDQPGAGLVGLVPRRAYRFDRPEPGAARSGCGGGHQPAHRGGFWLDHRVRACLAREAAESPCVGRSKATPHVVATVGSSASLSSRSKGGWEASWCTILGSAFKVDNVSCIYVKFCCLLDSLRRSVL